MRVDRVIPTFVEFIPEQLESGKLYISEKYGTAIHKCCCGCGEEVVTPLTPVDWRIVKRRGGVSLFPSVGNWNYQCQSHYIIRDNQIIWANKMTTEQIKKVQKRDFHDKKNYIEYLNTTNEENTKQAYQETIVTQYITKLGKKAWLFIKKLFNQNK
ncbi:MAG: DUF6527 family protein [Colwellia sp.]|jgi:hypothetical protein